MLDVTLLVIAVLGVVVAVVRLRDAIYQWRAVRLGVKRTSRNVTSTILLRVAVLHVILQLSLLGCAVVAYTTSVATAILVILVIQSAALTVTAADELRQRDGLKRAHLSTRGNEGNKTAIVRNVHVPSGLDATRRPTLR